MDRPGHCLPVTLLAALLLALRVECSNRSEVWPQSESGPLCRSRESLLPPEAFNRHACALCYRYMHEGAFAPRSRWNMSVGLWEEWDEVGRRRGHRILQLRNGNITLVVDDPDQESPLWESFSSVDWRLKWQECCQDAMRCCKRMIADNKTTEAGWCPRTWDGWGCWRDAPPSTVQKESCPAFIHIGTQPHSCAMFASKSCSAEGHWTRRDNGTGEEWTNYTTCSAVGSMRRRVLVSVSAYALTIAALIPAIGVFFCYRQLQVPRIILHKNLFASLLANAVCVILFKCLVILTEFDQKEDSITAQNGSACKLLLVLTKYFRLTNYMWMFCEGFYLHRLIAAAFAEQKSLVLFYLIGWGFPAIPTALYAILRATQADEHCWAAPAGAFEWCIILPSVLSLLINTVFLVNIIRVLFTKLRAAQSNEPSQYRKTVRATLVLLPLFGLHFVVTAYRPKGGGTCEWIELYFYADYLLDGMQGFLVALIFCYFNGEVHYLIKRSYFRFVESRNPSRRGGGSRSWLSVGNRNGSSGWDNRTRASMVHSTMVSSSLVEGGNVCRKDSAPCRTHQKGESIKNGDTIL